LFITITSSNDLIFFVILVGTITYISQVIHQIGKFFNLFNFTVSDVDYAQEAGDNEDLLKGH
jgi:hypothetical protein